MPSPEVDVTNYGTDTVATYSTDENGVTTASVVLNGVLYENMTSDFTDLLMDFCQQFNL